MTKNGDNWGLITVLLTLFLGLSVSLGCQKCSEISEKLFESPPKEGEFKGDLGLISTSYGFPVRWATGPIIVAMADDVPEWKPAIVQAIAYVNSQIGAELYTLAEPFAFVVVVTASEEVCSEHDCRAWTRASAEELTGHMRNAAIYLPSDTIARHPNAFCVVAHELGHALGLSDDGNDVKSLMSENMDLKNPCPPLTANDVRLLRGAYRIE